MATSSPWWEIAGVRGAIRQRLPVLVQLRLSASDRKFPPLTGPLGAWRACVAERIIEDTRSGAGVRL
jgi:hypothetical protein